MSTWAIIPVKPWRAAKTRLAPAMLPARRADLARRLFINTLAAARACAALDGVIVVSAGPEARALAAAHGALAYDDPPHPRRKSPLSRWVGDEGGEAPLNNAVALGCRNAVAQGAGAALVLPADLLLVTPNVLDQFLREAGAVAIAVAPDRLGSGTNALLLRPPCAIAPCFGPDSFHRHQGAAAAHGLTSAVVRLPELALDLDTPDDLALLQQPVDSALFAWASCG